MKDAKLLYLDFRLSYVGSIIDQKVITFWQFTVFDPQLVSYTIYFNAGKSHLKLNQDIEEHNKRSSNIESLLFLSSYVEINRVIKHWPKWQHIEFRPNSQLLSYYVSFQMYKINLR